MDPLTHLLTGACLARSGFHRKLAYATVATAVAAEFPDIDTLWSLRGSVSGFEHHRGITHTFFGVPFEAGLLLAAIYLWHRMRVRRDSKTAGPASVRWKNRPPLRWGALYGLILLGLLSHLLLDYTNSYGLRPFFPFNDRWYAGSVVFIFDPLLFALLIAGLVMPALFGFISREMGEHRRQVSSGWARAALTGVLLFWGVRTYEHGRAMVLAESTSLRSPAEETAPDDSPATAAANASPDNADAQVTVSEPSRPLLQAQRVLASPDPLSVFRWYTVADFGPAYQMGTADSRVGTLETGRLLIKPAPSAALSAAEASRLGRVYLDWSPMPFLQVEKGSMVPEEFLDSRHTQVILFEDPRFVGGTSLLQRGGLPPLTGEVVLGPADAVLQEGMDGRFGH